MGIEIDGYVSKFLITSIARLDYSKNQRVIKSFIREFLFDIFLAQLTSNSLKKVGRSLKNYVWL
jgi:hypothetical protein